MIKSKKQMFIVIGVFTLVMLLGTVTYAFFNYTRTGASNNIKVGRISFVSKDEETINLSNLFPIDPTEQGIMNDNTKVGTYQLTIEGDTDYSGGIEYLVSTVNSNLSNLPISINMTVGSGLGTSDTNYFTSRDTATTPIYKKIVGSEIVGDEILLVGFIPQNTTLGTSDETGDTITINAYLDKNKILISDTYDGTESDNMGTPNSLAQGKTVLTTEEWNQLKTNGISFKVKVEANEGIWVENPSKLYSIMKRKSVMDNIQSTFVSASTGINFKQRPSDTNGKGVYMRAGTENDTYPVVYYRGAVEDNNVLFADKCWKAVRSTDTGGVKLTYQGEKQVITEYEHNDVLSDTEIDYTNDTNYPYTYDSTVKTWTSTVPYASDGNATFTIHVKETSNYSINYDAKISGYSRMQIQVNNQQALSITSKEITDSYNLGTLTPSDEIKVTYSRFYSSEGDGVVFQIEKHYGDLSSISTCDISNNGIRDKMYNQNRYSLAYVGYMFDDTYIVKNEEPVASAYYGTGFTYDGTNYTLKNSTTTFDNQHHYTCNLTSADASCATLRYYSKIDRYDGIYQYVELSDGDGIEEALEKMNTNTKDSNAKMDIDYWYQQNMISYTSKLEDTIWCNDRSINQYGEFDSNGNNNKFKYETEVRVTNGTPSLACSNKNDAFTVDSNNGNQLLDYPVGLLTIDEDMLTGQYGWTMSPAGYKTTTSANYIDYANVYTSYNEEADVSGYTNGTASLFPSISLKPGTLVASGDGTALDPYVIE